MHSIRPQFTLSRHDRIRRLLHALVAMGVLFNMLAPAMVYAAPAPASEAATAPAPVPAGGTKSASRPVLGNGWLPAFLLDDINVTDIPGAKSASPSELGDSPLADWLSVISDADVEAAAGVKSAAASPPELGDSLLPAWMSRVSSEGSSPELGDSLLPAWLDGASEPAAAGDDAPVGEDRDELDPGLLPTWFTEPAGTSNRQRIPNPAPLLMMPGESCTPAASLNMQLTVPPYAVSRGNENGDVYTVTVSNGSATDGTTEVSLLIAPNVGFYYLDDSATVTSSADGTVPYSDTGTGAPGATSTITLTDLITQTSLAPGETITFTFKLATNAYAKSGQLLTVKLQSGSPPEECKTTQENVATVRGNLVVSKVPAAQDGSFGDVITWTVTLRNTGLGTVYSAIMTDTEGSGLSGLSATPTISPFIPITLTSEQSQVYTVTATVASCENLTNTVEASWSIGNADATGTVTNPVHDDVDIVYLMEDPDVSVEVGPLPPVDYCGAMSETIPVTLTNTGAAARNLRLSLSASYVTVTNLDGNWTQSDDTFTYKGGTPVTDTIRSGETITLTVGVTSTNVCVGRTASVSFTPIYDDACLLMLDVSGTVSTSSRSLGPDAPTLNLSKDGPDVVAAGDTFVYTVTVSGDNQESIDAGGVNITDIVPSELTINAVTATTGITNTLNPTVTWNLTFTVSGPYTQSLFINVTVPELGGGVCGAGSSFTNRVNGEADVCITCTLAATDTLLTYIQDFLGADNVFTKTASSIEPCAPGDAQIITAVLSIRNGITWTGSVYTDTLGADLFAEALNVVSDTTSPKVIINGVDRTSLVSYIVTPTLTIDFSNIGTYSPTADITITYKVTATASTISGTAATQTEFLFSEFTLGGDPDTACGGGNTGHFGTNITLRRGDLSVALSPATLSSCQENAITITVSGGSPDTLTDNIVVTFTVDASDVVTPGNPTLGGDFAGETVTVTQGSTVITFTFAITLDMDANGTISFPLRRPCTVTTQLQAGLSYQDYCAVTRTGGDTGGTSTTYSNLTLFTTPDKYVVNERTARWRFYVSNGGNQTASETTITNTLPSGYTFVTYTVSSSTAPIATLNSITFTTGTVGVREVVTFTIPSSPGLEAGDRIQFDVTSTVASCVSPTEVDIALFQACGQVEDTCGERAVGQVEFVKGDTSLLSSNDQAANLPLCEDGWVELVVKNTSAQCDEFDFTITDVITNATFVTQTARVTVTNAAGQVVTGTTSSVLLQNIALTPTVTTIGNTDTVTWTVTSYVTGTAAYDVLKERDASDVIRITFQIGTGCAGIEAEVQSIGAARDVCDDPLTFEEDSSSLITDAPELTIVKTGRNATTGSAFSELPYAGAGDTVVWQILVTNIGDQRVLNLIVTDTVPSNITITETNPVTTSQSGDVVTWEYTGTTTVLTASGGSMAFYITGTVESDGCSLSVTNTVQARFACTTTDICQTSTVSDTANLRTQPDVQVQSIVGDLGTCGGVITITLNNDGPPAQNVILTDTLPSEFMYDSTVFSTTAPITLPTPGDAAPVWGWNSVPTETTTLAFSVRHSQTIGSCVDPGTPVSDTVDVSYDDTCTNTGPYTATLSDNLAVTSLTLVVDKSPLKQVADVGGVVTWTISITNTTGTAIAPNILITDVVGSAYTNITATIGSYTGGGGNTPVVAGNTITWTPAITLPVDGLWTATVTATVGATGLNTNTVEAVGACAAGCIYTTTSDTAFVTLLAEFDKAPDIQTDTIGSSVVFTITASLTDKDGLYESLTITDTLPTGLGYITATLTYIGDIDGGGSPITATPTSSPTYAQSGDVIWQLGNVSGTAEITAVITAVIQNIDANQQGVSHTNAAAMTYIFDGQDYVFTDTTEVDIVEPTLIITKSVSPARAAPGDTVFFGMELYHATTSTVPAYNVLITDVVPTGLEYAINSWGQIAGPSADTLDDSNAPTLTASWSVVPTTTTQANPIRLSYQAVISTGVAVGSVFTNTITTTWTSLLTDPYGERRDGSGGVNDYQDADSAAVSLVEADLGVAKTGPITVTAGEQVTYTIVLSNTGPSTAQDVDVKDLLPSGLTFVSGTSTQGTCVSSICQLGDVSVNGVITIVITATVGSDVAAGAILTNTAQVYADTLDPNSDNNSDTAASTVNTNAALQIAKTDLTDPVYAGDTYFYEIVITNTGPSDALDVVVTDQLPAYVTFEGASPGCVHDDSATNGVVTCTVGTLTDGAQRDFLINTRVLSDTVSNTTATNYVTATTSTTTTLFTDSEPTTYKQKAGNPTDLALTKSVTPTSAVAGSGRFTYTLVITNNGPAAANAVQVVDAFPREFDFVSATASDGSTCNSGMLCILGTMAISEVVTITLVVDVPSDVVTGTYTNTATVGSESLDNTPDNNTDSEPVNVTEQAVLQIRKVANPDPATPGEDLNYTILVTNIGPSDADNVTISDTLPSDFTLALVTSSQGGCASLPCNLGTIVAGGSADLTINGAVSASAIANLVNTAEVTSTTTGTDARTVITTSLTGSADLALAKSATATVNAGETIAYTLTVYNNGPSGAQNLIITDTLPVSVTYASANSSCTETVAGSGVVTCALASLAASASSTFTITVTADSDIEPGASLENSATVTSTTPDGDASNNDATADTSIIGAADLSLSKTGPITVTAGESITYTIIVTNTGPSAAQSVDVKDTLPSGVTLSSVSVERTGVGPAACGGTVCQVGDMAVDEVITITVVGSVGADVADGTVLTNTATVFSDSPDSNTANNTDTATTTVETSADVSVTKVDLTDPVGPTEGLMYQIVVHNAGPSDAQDVVVTDTLDANVSFSGASYGCAETSAGSGVVTCTVGTLGADSTASYLIAVTAGDVPSGTIISNTVVVTSTTSDPTLGNNTDTVTTTVEQQFGPTADLAIAKVTASSIITAGEEIAYTLTVTNAGPQAGTNVRVLELLPAGTTVITITANTPNFEGEYCSLGGSCYLGTVYSTTTAVITVVLQVDADFSGSQLVNSAHVSADQRDPDTSNNIASTSTPVSASADLAIAKADLTDPVIAGEVLMYQIRITNTGPSDAANVIITDSVPISTSFVGASDFCAETGGAVTCTLSTVAAGDTRSAFVQVRVDSDVVSPTIITNTAYVSSATSDPDSTDNSDTITTTAQQSALNPTDLTISKSDDPDPVIAGQTLTYTLIITNEGPATASNVQVVDALPNGTILITATASQGLCNSGITCDLGDVAAGNTATITVVVTVDSDQINDITNFARVSASNPDSDDSNNDASEVTTVDELADLSISKTADPITATPGSSLSYEIVITNAGPSDSQNVVVTDTLPTELSGVSFSASQGSCTPVGVCTLGTVPAGGNATISVIGDVSTTAADPFTNTVVVSSTSTTDPISDNNQASVTTPVSGRADLSISKSDGPDPVRAGENLVYTLTVRNSGPSAATAVTVTDQLPSDATFVGATLGCVGSNPLVCGLGAMDVDETQTLTVEVTVNSDVSNNTLIYNTASVESELFDPDLSNNSDTVQTQVIAQADLGIVKTGEPNPVLAGEQITYTLTVTNYGPSDAVQVQVLDSLPIQVTLLSSEASQGYCGGPTCIIGTMTASTSAVITLVAQVKTDVVTGTQILNVGLASSPTYDPGPNINFAVASNRVETNADVYISKTHSSDVVAGNELTYQVIVGNDGPSLARDVVVTDTLPLSLTYVSDSDSCVRVATDPDVLRCSIGNLEPDSSESFEITVLADQALAAGVVTNTIEVTSTTTDSDPQDNSQEDPTTVLTQADLRLTKTDTPDPVVAGEQITYTLTAINDGPSRAMNVVVTDTLPSGVTYITDTDNCALVATDPDVLVCSLGNLDASATVAFQVVANVSPTVLAASTLFNDATVGSGTTDPDPTDNDASAPTSVSAAADVGVTKSGPADPVIAGAAITYTLVVSNSGPSAAEDVDVKDFLPDGVSLVSAKTYTGAPCLGTLCQLGLVEPGEVTTITVGVLIDTNVVSGTELDNMVAVFSDTPDPNSDNDLDTLTNTVASLASIQVEKRDLSDPVAPESLLIYSIVVTNTGPSDAANVVVSDTLPAQVTYMGSTDSCVESPVGTLSCTLNKVAAGSTQSFLVTVRVDATVVTGTVLTNRVSITSTTPLTNSVLTDDEDTLVQQSFGPPADLAVAKDAITSTVVAGEFITYTLVVTNSGPGTTTDVEVTDSLPDGLTFVSATPSQGECDSGVTCLLGIMLFDGSPSTATITIVASVNPDVAAGTTLTNTAFVQSSLLDPNEGNNRDDAAVGVNAVADLEVAKTDSPDPAVAGELLAYTIVITNHGPSDAANVVVTDTLPTSVTVNAGASDPCFTDVGGNRLVCTLSSLGAGESTTLDIVVEVLTDATGSLLNNVIVDSQTPDPVSANNDDDETTTITTSADLSIEKVVISETATAGELITYTLTVRNAGPSVAQSVQVTDQLHSDVSFDSATPGYAGPNPLVWSIGTLNPGETRVFTVAVRVNSDVAEGALIRNTASVGSSTPDPVSSNDEDDATTQIFGVADLGITKGASDDPVVAGEVLTYTITVHNDGPSVATDVDVKDLLPPGLTLDQWLTSQGACAGTICQLGDVPVSTTVVITAVATVDPSLTAGTQLTNTAVVFSDTPDSNDGNNTAEVTVTVETLADLLLSKSAVEDIVASGSEIIYTIVVTNAGPSDARGVIVTDTLPSDVTYNSDTDSCSEVAPGELECALGAIPAGDVVAFNIIATLDSDASGAITNTARVNSDEPDSTSGNNEDSVSILVVSGPYIEAEKQDSLYDDADGNGIPSPGDTLLYQITIVNYGTGPATDVNFTDLSDPNTTLVTGSVTTSDGTITSGNGPGDISVAVDINTLPGFGSSVDISFRVVITDPLPPGVTYVSNQGTVISVELPDEPTDDPDTGLDDDPTITPVPYPAISLTKSLDSDDPAYVAELVTFTIRITNTGNTTQVTVPLTDTYDTAYFTFVSATPQPDVVNSATGQLVWYDLTGPPPNGFGVVFPPGAIVSVQVVLRAIHYTPEGVKAENRAEVSGVEDELGEPLPDVVDEDDADVTVLPNIEVSKHADVDGPIEVGAEITFTIQITNIGTIDIVTLPLTDTYDPAYLSFVRADPSHDRYTPGTVEWDDLTGLPPNGFGASLTPGNSFSLQVVFTAIAATESVTNTVFVENGVDVNGNPANGLADTTIIISEEPTGAVLRFFTATASDDEVTLVWETITEIDNLGFHLWRSSQPEAGYQRVNSVLIPSQAFGASGAHYEFVDGDVPDGAWFYKLEILSITGQTSGWHGPVSIWVGDAHHGQVYLPLLWKLGVGD